MRKSLIPVLAVAMALSVATPAPVRAADDAAKAIAILLALGIGIAAAKQAQEDDNQWNTELYGEPFSPSANVVCLPKPRKCYEHGRLSHRWTYRIFG
ncbi:MAG: hypothetical protein ACK4KW_03085 [Gemmobacter sp.]